MLQRGLYILLIIAVFASCKSNRQPVVLLFNGAGVSTNDVTAIETLLETNKISYSTANAAELNSMAMAEMRQYKLLIMPGGNFIDMGKSLDTSTSTKIRIALQQGLHYLGICAGGFLAGHSAYYNSFNLTSGVRFGFYTAEKQGTHKAALTIANAGAAPIDQYWEDGPDLSGWGTVVAKYPDGTAAVVEGNCGSGFVILTGIHAEAPASWRHGLAFNTSVDASNLYAVKLIRAALDGVALPHY